MRGNSASAMRFVSPPAQIAHSLEASSPEEEACQQAARISTVAAPASNLLWSVFSGFAPLRSGPMPGLHVVSKANARIGVDLAHQDPQ